MYVYTSFPKKAQLDQRETRGSQELRVSRVHLAHMEQSAPAVLQVPTAPTEQGWAIPYPSSLGCIYHFTLPLASCRYYRLFKHFPLKLVWLSLYYTSRVNKVPPVPLGTMVSQELTAHQVQQANRDLMVAPVTRDTLDLQDHKETP